MFVQPEKLQVRSYECSRAGSRLTCKVAGSGVNNIQSSPKNTIHLVHARRGDREECWVGFLFMF